jgi:peptidoglycan hydrolase CwlO-like protein
MKKFFSVIFLSLFTIGLFFSISYADVAQDPNAANRTYNTVKQDCFAPAGDCFDDIVVTG